MKNLIKSFNQPDTLLVVSSYPDPKIGIKDMDAVAWHSQKTLKGISKTRKVVVFSNISASPTPYTNTDSILVFPSWVKGNPFSLFTVLKNILKFNQATTVLFQFEFNIYGGVLPVVLIPLMMALLRLLGKKIIFEIHQVITDIKTLSTHLNLNNPLFQKIFNFGLINFYRAIGIISNQIVVLEEELKFRLQHFISPDKINFIPISVIKKNTSDQSQSKIKLGFKPTDFVVVTFGFVNWYKGSDWIATTFSKIKNNNIKLVLAGGPSPTLKDKPYYQRLFAQIQNTVSQSPNITLTGFVPDSQVKLYFSAADLIVLPYRVFMSSSGPLSLAYSYGKPMIFSEILSKNYIHSPDFKQSLTDSKLTLSNISFSINSTKFIQTLNSINQNSILKKLTSFSLSMQSKRSQKNTTNSYIKLITSLHPQTSNPSFIYTRRLFSLK